MPDYNKLILIGRLTKDVENSFTKNGTSVAKSTIAVNDGYGENKSVMFIDFSCFGKTSDFLAKYFKKGSPILIEGKLKQESWEKDGQKRSKHVMDVLAVSFVGGEKKEEVSDVNPVSNVAGLVNNDDVPF